MSMCRLCILLMIICSAGCVDISKYPTPESTYEVTFGTLPPTTISGLQGEGSAFRDSGYAYLKFKVSQKVLMTLIGSSFAPISRTQFSSRTSNGAIKGPTPRWWTPLAGKPTLFMESKAFHPSFSSGEAFLSYDAATQVVCFYWDGSD